MYGHKICFSGILSFSYIILVRLTNIDWSCEECRVWKLLSIFLSPHVLTIPPTTVFKDRWAVLSHMLLIPYLLRILGYSIWDEIYFIDFGVFKPCMTHIKRKKDFNKQLFPQCRLKYRNNFFRGGRAECLFSEIKFKKRINHQPWVF